MFNDQTLRIKTFENYFKVSKNTIMNDLTAVKQFFKRYQIELYNDKKYGYYVKSPSNFQRNVIYEIIKRIEIEEYHAVFDSILAYNQSPSLINT
ncbi:helix-turn-helix domain-containing protein [Staphylococcus coagulans]|uniref:helix-turn-helix domain-containing protein n=1 Tax=Staphylococcus coagulans TaxID=74706 RepID=UPI001FDA727F|nr:helix-turn-helix domain-containing protein [Staphylococcus coagulans]